jgi:protein-tyrosine-phosphatase
MAEAVARELVVTALGGPSHLSRPRQIELLTAFGYRLESAGIGPPHGSPPSPHAVVAAAEAGLSLEGHAARGVDRELLEEFETVFAMGGRHKHWLDELNAANVKIEMLSPGRDVEDPFGGTLHDYRATLARLRADVEARLPEIL